MFVHRPQPADVDEIVKRVQAEWPFDGAVTVVSARQKSRHRALVEIEHEGARFVVKRAPRDRVERGHRALEKLWAAGFAPPAPHRVPRPVLLTADGCISVHERAPGRSLALSDEHLAPTILEYLARLQAADFGASGGLVPAHGDLSPKHIFHDSESMTWIDWDKFMFAPPTMDLGYLIARIAIADWTPEDGFGRSRAFRSRLLPASRPGVAEFAASALRAAAEALTEWTGGSDAARAKAYIEAAERIISSGSVHCL